jgi:ribosome assembly protein YihI (activator of Der GTPase)
MSANKIKQKIKEYLKDPENLREFLTSILETRTKKIENKEATATGGSSGSFETLFSGEEPKKVEAKEGTSTASSGSYETTAAWAKSSSKKDWRGKSKTQIPGGKFVQVKKKCKKFPYCNQGDINALKIFENDTIKKVINNISNKMDIHEDFIKEIIYKEIVKRNSK